MPEFSLGLKLNKNAGSPGRRVSRVWLHPSGDPESCMDLVESWGFDLDEVCYVALPGSDDKSRSAEFVLIAPAPVPVRHPGLVRCHRYENSPLWLPETGSLKTPVLPHEWKQILPYVFAYFCPVRGIIACSESDLRPLTDLVRPPPVQSTGEPMAAPGEPVSREISDVLPGGDSTTETLFADERSQGLGEGDPRDMPLKPGEKQPRGMRLWLLNKLRRLTDTDETDDDVTWLGRVGKWADWKWREASRKQERELGRLLHLLKHDPDEGLRYALPLNGRDHRGVAPPSGKLTPRRVGFNVNRLGGGGPASPWVLEWQRYQELSDQYRKTANDALKAGRHRRAAYVFAELLRDYRQAAQALRQGGYHREAAVIHQTHLGDALEAAACLREGGHLREAIVIYEKKKKLETVAELYETLGERETSRSFYEQAVAVHQAQGDLLAAARLLETALEAPGRAVELLAGAWPGHVQASACLNEELRLRLRYGSNEEIIERLDTLCRSANGGLAAKLSPVLGRLMSRIPDRALREKAADCAWNLAGDFLNTPNRSNEKPVLDLLPMLAEGDPLLKADATRFGQISAGRRKGRLLQRGGRVFQLLQSQALPSQISWKQVAGRSVYGFAAVGEKADGELIAMRGDWDGNFQLCPIPGMRADGKPFRLLTSGDSAPEIFTLAGLAPSGVSVTFPVDEQFTVPAVIDTPSWYRQEGAIGMAYAAGGVGWLVRRHHDELVLHSHSLMGDLIATHSLAAVQGNHVFPAAPIPMTAVWGQLLVGLGHDLIRFHRDRIDARVMPVSVVRIVANEHTIEPRFAVQGSKGVVINSLTEGWRSGDILPIDSNLSAMTFTVGGQLLVAGPGRLEVWRIGPDGNGEPVAHEEFDGGVPLAVHSAGSHDTFAVVTQKRCFIFRVGLRRAGDKVVGRIGLT